MNIDGIRIIDVDTDDGKNIIAGTYTEVEWYGAVTFDGKPLLPTRSQRVYNHSPSGFAWGYHGSGPAQLALAILLEAGVPELTALRHYQAFKDEFIARLKRDSFRLAVDIKGWIARQEVEFAKRD